MIAQEELTKRKRNRTGDLPANTNKNVCEALHEIARSMHNAKTLSAGEAATDKIAEALDMPLPYWVFDVAHPYYCRRQDEYSRNRGWPDNVMELWWSQHAALKMPHFIRCRFEHLPFVTRFDKRPGRRSSRATSEKQRLNELVLELGVTSMLTVPLHLPRGQVAMLSWAGGRDPEELNALLGCITGHLLTVGHNFMRIYKAEASEAQASSEEYARLTPREWDCLRTLAQGYRETEVARVTGISKATVRYHLNNVVQKFGCKHRIQAVAIAAQLGLLGPVGR